MDKMDRYASWAREYLRYYVETNGWEKYEDDPTQVLDPLRKELMYDAIGKWDDDATDEEFDRYLQLAQDLLGDAARRLGYRD